MSRPSPRPLLLALLALLGLACIDLATPAGDEPADARAGDRPEIDGRDGPPQPGGTEAGDLGPPGDGALDGTADDGRDGPSEGPPAEPLDGRADLPIDRVFDAPADSPAPTDVPADAPADARQEAGPAACTGQAQCGSGSFCDAGGTCRPKRTGGAGCGLGLECASGFCVDAVCCDGACNGACLACNLVGSLGACRPIAVGQDPGAECAAQPAATCGRAGGCDGAGACRLHPDGTACADRSCSGATETAASQCNGRGGCLPGATRSCGAYLCAGTACRVSCSMPSHCQAGHACLGSACVPCTPESNSGFCQRLGKNCGGLTGVDNCGAPRSVPSCGTCTAPSSCGGGGVANVCGVSASPCQPAYAQSSCTGYTVGTRVSHAGRNWTCANGNCANCANQPGCAPGASGCPWGTVWTDGGACR